MPGDQGTDPLARLGDALARDLGGDDARDSRKNKVLPRELAGLVLLRAQGFDNHEIAEKLRVSKAKLRRMISQARREYAWDDLGHKLADVALPQAVDNVIRHLDHEASAEAIATGQSLMTRTVAQGLGAFKHHAAVKSEVKKTEIQVLRVEIAMPQLPPGDQGMLGLGDGAVLATPRRARQLAATAHPALVASDVPVLDGEVVR